MAQIDARPRVPAPRRPWRAMAREGARGVPALRRARRWMRAALSLGEARHDPAADLGQKALMATWRQLHAQGVVLPFDQVGFSAYSEFEEDGILLYLLTLAGARSRIVVEISAQDGRVCMATNLVVHHRWQGFLFDGDPVFVAEGRRFFAAHPATRAAPPRFEARWFTSGTVNEILAEAGVPEEVDLLSLDIDGVDLHLWRALTATWPRVLVAEFNNAVPSDLSLTVPDRPDFDHQTLPPEQQMFRSASLAAYIKVSRAKGYRFVGMNALGFNAVFLRDDVLADEFPELPATVLDANAQALATRARHWPALRHLPWQEV